MFHRLTVNGIADHLGERADIRILGDEAMIPPLFLRPDQHQFKPALPDDPPTEPRKHRAAFPAIGRIGLRAGRLAAIRIGRLFPQADQVEHVDRTRPIIGLKLREHFLGRIDMAHAWSPFLMALQLYHAPPQPQNGMTFLRIVVLFEPFVSA